MSQLGQAISLLEQAIGRVESIAQERADQDDLFAQNNNQAGNQANSVEAKESDFANDVKDDLGDVQSITPKEFRDRLNGVIVKMEALLKEDA